jgi:hypothetical protein
MTWSLWQQEPPDMRSSPCCGERILGTLVQRSGLSVIEGRCARCQKPLMQWSPERDAYRVALKEKKN